MASGSASRIQIKASLESFAFNAAAYHELIRGPILRDLVRRAIRVETQAKLTASNASPSPPGQGPGVRTGLLRASITWRPGLDAISPYVDVGSAVEYAAYVELGTSRMAARPFLRPSLDAARVSF